MSTPFEFLNSSIRIAPGRRVVSSEEYHRFLQAGEILEEARKQAGKIKADAISAYESRRLEGYKDGLAQADEEKAVFCFQVARDFSDAIDGVEERLANLFPQILRNLLGDLGKDLAFTSYIDKALHDLVFEEKLTIKVHPSRRQLMEDHVDKLQRDSQGAFKYLRVRGDATLEQDQATIETASSIVVLDLQRQIDFISTYVQERLQSEKTNGASDVVTSAETGQVFHKATANQHLGLEDEEDEKPFRVFE